MNIKNLHPILLLLTYFATQHDAINAMKRSHNKISDTQQKKQLLSNSKKRKINRTTAALLCTICNKSFSKTSELTIHTRIHTGEKPYKCDICHKAFAQQGHLTIHKRIHTGEKPYNCNTCDKSFADKSNFRKHEKTHTDEKSYTCNICNKSFSQKSNLATHKKIHIGEKPYSCDICQQAFAHTGNLTTHKKTHTKTITPIINLVKTNTEQISTQITKDISPESFNIPADSQKILENIMTLDDTEFHDWINKKK